MVKFQKIANRYFYIYYIFLSKYGIFGGSEKGVIVFFSGFSMFISMASFLRLKVRFDNPILLLIAVNIFSLILPSDWDVYN